MKNMTKTKKLMLYGAIFVSGLLGFILQMFVFSAPNGPLGLLLCLLEIFAIFGGAVKLSLLCERMKCSFLSALDILFWLP